jgi:hypothetical protein
MITNEQKDRAEKEFAAAAGQAARDAAPAERELEFQNYPSGGRRFDFDAREKALREFQEADYLAESRAYVRDLIRRDREPKAKPSIPATALCFFKDGDQWCCVNGDFKNLMESPAGFGDTFADALNQLGSQVKELVPVDELVPA